MQPKDMLNANSNNIKIIKLKLSSISLSLSLWLLSSNLKSGNFLSASLFYHCYYNL